MNTVEAFDAGLIDYDTFLWAVTNECTGFVKYGWTPPEGWTPPSETEKRKAK
jgi:hypothetical protein